MHAALIIVDEETYYDLGATQHCSYLWFHHQIEQGTYGIVACA